MDEDKPTYFVKWGDLSVEVHPIQNVEDVWVKINDGSGGAVDVKLSQLDQLVCMLIQVQSAFSGI